MGAHRLLQAFSAGTLLRRLTQDGVLRSGFLMDRHVGVGVFPKRQEIFIRFSRCLLIVHGYPGNASIVRSKERQVTLHFVTSSHVEFFG
jgi:hypothetical protein